MKIDKVRLFNYAGHSDLSLSFSSKFNCIVGVNGSGKTSILKAISESLIAYTGFIPGANNNLGDPLASIVAHIKVEKISERYRFEPQFPFGIDAKGTAFGEDADWMIFKENESGGVGTSGNSPGNIWQRHQQKFENTPPTNDRYPLVCFYRANRHWATTQPNELAAVTAKESRFSGYMQWSDASLDSGGLQRWAISKSLERLEFCVDNNLKFDEVLDDELALVNQALAVALDNAKGLRYDLGRKSLLMEWKHPGFGSDSATPFSNLSDGQRAFIGLVSDIARRMCLLNPELGQLVTTHTDGIVLIDELDMHLHPRWQRLIATGLKAAFPSIQFIVASHSPLIIGSLHPDEIVLLQSDGTSQPKVSYGMDPSEIMQEIMGSGIRPDEVEKLISKLYESLDRNQIEEARKSLRDLTILAPGIHDIASAAALLKRKEILGK